MTVGGEVLAAGSAGYESARRSQIARFDGVRPHAVVRCRVPEDVAQALASAKEEGQHVALRSGGHCFAGRSSTTGIVIDLSGMNEVSVSDGTVTVGAGARLAEVYDALAAHDRTIAAGCGPTVGIAGLTLGGGLGILGRSHGLTSDQLVAARAVLADGRIVDCDKHRNEDLFWALRGAGGGQFAAVTQLVLRTLSAPHATGFHLMWPWTAAAAVVGAWQEWAPDAPDPIAASLLVRGPADSDQPPIVTVFGTVLHQESAARAALDEFVAAVGAAPAKTNYAPGPYREVKRYLAEYDISSGARRPVEREPGHSYSKSEFFRRELPADVIADLLALLAEGRRQREARVLDFTPWAGAYNRVPAEATAFAHRAERFLLKQEVLIDAGASEDERQAVRGWLSRSWALVHPWGSGGAYPNFPDPDLEDWGRALPRREPGPAQAGEGDVRPKERLPVRSVGLARLAIERAEGQARACHLAKHAGTVPGTRVDGAAAARRTEARQPQRRGNDVSAHPDRRQASHEGWPQRAFLGWLHRMAQRDRSGSPGT